MTSGAFSVRIDTIVINHLRGGSSLSRRDNQPPSLPSSPRSPAMHTYTLLVTALKVGNGVPFQSPGKPAYYKAQLFF